jgi:hypothetical protein
MPIYWFEMKWGKPAEQLSEAATPARDLNGGLALSYFANFALHLTFVRLLHVNCQGRVLCI